jgi:hypothetical protein
MVEQTCSLLGSLEQDPTGRINAIGNAHVLIEPLRFAGHPNQGIA